MRAQVHPPPTTPHSLGKVRPGLLNTGGCLAERGGHFQPARARYTGSEPSLHGGLMLLFAALCSACDALWSESGAERHLSRGVDVGKQKNTTKIFFPFLSLTLGTAQRGIFTHMPMPLSAVGCQPAAPAVHAASHTPPRRPPPRQPVPQKENNKARYVKRNGANKIHDEYLKVLTVESGAVFLLVRRGAQKSPIKW